MSVHCLYAQCPRELVDVRSPRAGVTDAVRSPAYAGNESQVLQKSSQCCPCPLSPLSSPPHLLCALYSVRCRWHLLSCCEDWLSSELTIRMIMRMEPLHLLSVCREAVLGTGPCRMTFPLRVKSFFVIENKSNGQNHVSSHLLPLIAKCDRVRHYIVYLLF